LALMHESCDTLRPQHSYHAFGIHSAQVVDRVSDKIQKNTSLK